MTSEGARWTPVRRFHCCRGNAQSNGRGRSDGALQRRPSKEAGGTFLIRRLIKMFCCVNKRKAAK